MAKNFDGCIDGAVAELFQLTFQVYSSNLRNKTEICWDRYCKSLSVSRSSVADFVAKYDHLKLPTRDAKKKPKIPTVKCFEIVLFLALNYK